jgi:hypothetical protein
MRTIKGILKVLLLIALFCISYFTRIPDVMVEETGDGSIDLRSGNLIAGGLVLLFLPVFILSLMALYYARRKDPSRWTVRFAWHLAYVLTLSTHLLAYHIGQWSAVFNPAAILADNTEDPTMRVVSCGIALFFLAATLPALISFLSGGKRGQGAADLASPSPIM